MSSYRSDIDGLRALAVLPVILYHLNFDWFPGGFVGVDIFFVISGFLIGSIIISEADRKDFSIYAFYERRIRRIFPALFAVLAISTVAASIILLPDDLVEFGKSALATLGFVSNIFFWRQSGYFDAAAELKPLLHTWSLAVEEQFYIFFPILVMMTFGRKRILKFLLILGLIGSFSLSVYGVRYHPDATF
jgi:peptidoglycan/LPS O-acetylase OafA/YrhL